jgi:hypothetical protein
LKVKLRVSLNHYETLKKHLFPGDGCEAVAVAICGRRSDVHQHVLCVQKVVVIPYDECKVRSSTRVTWSTKRLIPLLDEAARSDLAILKIHSHPGGYDRFSSIDDDSDADLFNSIFGWTDSHHPHASVVMLPDGGMFGRAALSDGTFVSLDSISVPGDDIRMWPLPADGRKELFTKRHSQLFGHETIRRLRNLSVGVVGCSGTGSPLIEQLARLGVGRLVLVDSDHVEEKNLNRILNASREDAYLRRPKVEVMARAIARMGLGTELDLFNQDLGTPDAIRAVASCDVVFGCMDGVEGRHLLGRLARFYLLPYFDIGVGLSSDGEGGIDEACGAVHYLRPDGSTLLDRKVYSMDQIRAASLKRTDPNAYREQVTAGYIKGVREDRPAVISINMQMASIAVNEFLSRLHPFRLDENSASSVVRLSFIQPAEYRESEAAAKPSSHIGRGDVKPLLNMPHLSELHA